MDKAMKMRKRKIKHLVYMVLMVAMLLGVPIFNATAIILGAPSPIIDLDD